MNNWKDKIKKEKLLIIVLFFVFLASVSYAFYYKIKPQVDAAAYDKVAVNITEGNGFRIDPSLPLDKDEAIMYNGPLYQYFLSGVYVVFGHHYEAVWIIQSLLRVLTALLIFLTCSKIFKDDGRRIGFIAMLFFGFYPDLIEINAMIMTETLFIFLAVLTTYIFARYYDNFNFKGSFFLGSSLALAVLMRSSVSIFILPFLFYFLTRKNYKYLAVFFLAFIVFMTPWTIRNYAVYHRFLPTMANFGYNPWMGNFAGGDGEWRYRPELAEAQKKY